MAEQPPSNALDFVISRIFSLPREFFILSGIIFVGLIIRIIAANNVSDDADSMHFVTQAINFLSSGKLEISMQSAGLWHALTSVFYNFFGISSFSVRLASLIFGTAII